MTTKPWQPDVEVAVHDQELIVKLDHLPEVAEHRFAADWNEGELQVRSENLADGVIDHDLHLPLPDGLEVSHWEAEVHGESFELHMTVPSL